MHTQVSIGSSDYILRTASHQDVPELRRLVNSAYKELSDKGLNYTATFQDEAKTLERISKGTAYVLELDSKIVATILLTQENHFTGKNTAYIGQFAVAPHLKKNGLGSYLIKHCEKQAQMQGYDGVQLDTAIPATHLVSWYLKLDYKIVGEMHLQGKTYKSYIFEKLFSTQTSD